jgi:hypothetical protein
MVLPGASIPCHVVRLDWYVIGTDRDVNLQVVSDPARAGWQLFCSLANRVEVSVAGGAYQTVGDTADTGANLGGFAAGQAKDITVRYNCASTIRAEECELMLDLGIWTAEEIAAEGGGFGSTAFEGGDAWFEGEDSTFEGGGT